VKALLTLLVLCLSGCTFYVEDGGVSQSSGWGVSLDSALVECYYGGYYDVAEWHFQIHADSAYGAQEVMEVGFYINGYDYQYMDYYGDGVWYRMFLSTYYDCSGYYDLEFVGVDYSGYEGYYTYYW